MPTAGALVRATRSPSTRRAAPESIARAANSAPSAELRGAAGDQQRRGAVEQHDVAQRPAGAGQQIAHQPRVVRRLAAVQIVEPRRGSPASSGVISKVSTWPWSSSATVVDTGGGQFVEPVAVHDPGALAAEPAQHLGHRPHPFGREHADQLAPRRPGSTAAPAG